MNSVVTADDGLPEVSAPLFVGRERELTDLIRALGVYLQPVAGGQCGSQRRGGAGIGQLEQLL